MLVLATAVVISIGIFGMIVGIEADNQQLPKSTNQGTMKTLFKAILGFYLTFPICVVLLAAYILLRPQLASINRGELWYHTFNGNPFEGNRYTTNIVLGVKGRYVQSIRIPTNGCNAEVDSRRIFLLYFERVK